MTKPLTKAQKQHAKYWTRKLQQTCVYCRSDLDGNGVMCSLCSERQKQAKARYIAGGGNVVVAKLQASRRARLAAAGLCIYCGDTRISSTMCQAHLDERKRLNRELRERKRAAKRAAPPVSVPNNHGRTLDRIVGMSRINALWYEAHRAEIGQDSPEENWEARSASKKYERLLTAAGIPVSAVNEPPPGWTVEDDIREEWLALSEHLALRRIA